MARPHSRPIVKTTDLYRAAAKQLFCFAWNRGGDWKSASHHSKTHLLKTTGDRTPASRTRRRPKALFMAAKMSLSRKNNILRHASTPLCTPIYMVCRGTRKNRGECYRTRRRLHGLTERRFAARAVIRVPPRVRAQRPTSRVFLQRQGLDRLTDKGHARTGLTALGQ